MRKIAAASLLIQASGLDRVLLPEGQYEGGRCMDGSMAGYYYGPPSSGSSTLWVIFLQGGGVCSTEQACEKWADAKGGRGGSGIWKPTMQQGGTLSPDPAQNPDFHDAHHVHVPYCTGDTHAGQVTAPTEAQWGWYFDGHLNVKAIAHHIMTTRAAAADMQRVLFQGTSAGGKGVLHNCDFLQSYVAELGSSALVSCVPQSGWFLPGFAEDNSDPDAPPTPWEYWINGQLAPIAEPPGLQIQQTYLPERCVAAHATEPWKCLSAQVMYPPIQAPVYVIQDVFDTNALLAQLGLPSSEVTTTRGKEFIAYFGRSMRNSTDQIAAHPAAKLGDGLFLSSCFNHGSNARLAGVLKFDALGDWFFDRGNTPTVLVDNCTMSPPGLPCNSFCNGIPDQDSCQAMLVSLCGDQSSTPWRCMQCAQNNPEELLAAGCTADAVRQMCSSSLVNGAGVVRISAWALLALVLWLAA